LFDLFAKEIETDVSEIIFALDGETLDRGRTLESYKIDVTTIIEARPNYTGECKMIQVSFNELFV
jgi:hypothetical protein